MNWTPRSGIDYSNYRRASVKALAMCGFELDDFDTRFFDDKIIVIILGKEEITSKCSMPSAKLEKKNQIVYTIVQKRIPKERDIFVYFL